MTCFFSPTSTTSTTTLPSPGRSRRAKPVKSSGGVVLKTLKLLGNAHICGNKKTRVKSDSCSVAEYIEPLTSTELTRATNLDDKMMTRLHKLISKSDDNIFDQHHDALAENKLNQMYEFDKADSEPEYAPPSTRQSTGRLFEYPQDLLSSLKRNLTEIYLSNDSVGDFPNAPSSVDEEIASIFNRSTMNRTSSFVKGLESRSSWQFIPGIWNLQQQQLKTKLKNGGDSLKSKLKKKFAILTKFDQIEDCVQVCTRLFTNKHVNVTREEEQDSDNNNRPKLRCVLSSMNSIIVVFEARFDECQTMSKKGTYVIMKLKFLFGDLKIFNGLAGQLQYFFERSPHSSQQTLNSHSQSSSDHESQ